jgi:hypothetical protein
MHKISGNENKPTPSQLPNQSTYGAKGCVPLTPGIEDVEGAVPEAGLAEGAPQRVDGRVPTDAGLALQRRQRDAGRVGWCDQRVVVLVGSRV